MSTDKTEVAMKGQVYKRLAESFYPLLVVFYHYQFRTKKSLELSLDWLKTSQYPAAACHSRAIHETAQYLLDSRKEHCKFFAKQLKPFHSSFVALILCHRSETAVFKERA